MINQEAINLEGYIINMIKPLVMNLVSEAMSNLKPTPLRSVNNYLNTKDASAFISKTPNALRLMVFKNQIKSMKKGEKLYFLEDDLIEYLESGRKAIPQGSVNCDDVLVLKNKRG